MRKEKRKKKKERKIYSYMKRLYEEHKILKNISKRMLEICFIIIKYRKGVFKLC
jgi:hypothetical protein